MPYYDRFTTNNYFQAPVNDTSTVGKFRFCVNTSEGNATLWCTDTHTGQTGRIVFRFVTATMFSCASVIGMNYSCVIVDVEVRETNAQMAHTRRYEIPMTDFRPEGVKPKQHANTFELEQHVEYLEGVLGSKQIAEGVLQQNINATRKDVLRTTARINAVLDGSKTPGVLHHL